MSNVMRLFIIRAVHKFFKITLLDRLDTSYEIELFLQKNFAPSIIKVYGIKLFIDKDDRIISRELLLTGKWEELQTNVLKSYIKKGHTVLDIGGHIGFYTLLASRLVGKNGKVISFEPDTKNFTLLRKNIKVNKAANIIAIKRAVSNKNETTKLFLSATNTGDHKLYITGSSKKSIKINTTTIDSYLNDKSIQHIDVIKMDIQGYEPYALEGMEKLFRDNRKLIMICEYWPYGLILAGSSEDNFFNLLKKYRFDIKEIDDRKNKVIDTTVKNLQRKYTFKKGNHTNLLCIHD